MTMRRISVLLMAVVMMLTMAMSTALADGNRRVCIERKNRPDIQINNLTKREQNNILDRRANAVRGACDNNNNGGGGGGFPNIARITSAPFR